MPPKYPKNENDQPAMVQAEEAYRRKMVDLGMVLYRMGEQRISGDMLVMRISIRMPDDTHGDCLVTIVAESADGTPMVMFTSGRAVDETLHTAISVAHSGEGKWKDDKFRGG